MTASAQPVPDWAFTRRDRWRQIAVTVGMVLCAIGALMGTGILGTPQIETADGAFAPTATLLAPARQAFQIWSVIYLGLIAFTVWQWLPAHQASARQRRIGWWVAASLVLNFVWIVTAQLGWLWAGALVIASIVACVAVTVDRLSDMPATSWQQQWAVDVGLGLYLGWTCVATAAHLTTTLIRSGADPGGGAATTLALTVIGVVTALALFLSHRLRGRISVVAAMAWGLIWIAHQRIIGGPRDLVVSAVAATAALLILAAGLAAWSHFKRRRKESRRRSRQRERVDTLLGPDSLRA